MKNYSLLGCVVLLAACAKPASQTGTDAVLIGVPAGPPVAVVNGETITEPLLAVYARGRGLDLAQPAMREQALASLIENLLLAQDAKRNGLMEKPDVQAEVALVRMQQMAGRSMAEKRKSISVDDAQIQALYDQEQQRAGDTEWRIEHILLADQAEAEAALAEATAKGGDLQAVMASFPQALQAKELPWGNASQMPSELVEALKQMEVGQLAPVVIKTRYGFHVLKLLEQRPFTPPPLDSVRDGARQQLTENALREYVSALRQSAQVSTSATAPTPADKP